MEPQKNDHQISDDQEEETAHFQFKEKTHEKK